LSNFPSTVIPNYRVIIDDEKCIRCRRCVQQCGWGTYTYSKSLNKILPDEHRCVDCLRCVPYCPTYAITIMKNPLSIRENANWEKGHVNAILKQAMTGGVLLGGMGTPKYQDVIWDHLLLDACQVTNPAIDPIREPMELRTYLGRKPDKLNVYRDKQGHYHLQTPVPEQIMLDAPIIIAPMSLGSISLNAQLSIAIAASRTGILFNLGEGGLHPDIEPYKNNMIVQCASGRFGVNVDYLNAGRIVEIKIGQGAKPGIGGHLPGEKVTEMISTTRYIPEGTDALSPAPHHDIYSIEDLRQLIYAIKEATGYKPVSVKIAAVHNVAAIASGIVRAGADILYLDGFRGGTGAAPQIIRDNLGIPIEIAVAVVDERLRNEGIRNQASIIAAGSIRSSADAVKAITLGADAVAIGTATLISLGCTVCGQCHTGNCSWGITTQRPELVRRLDPEVFSERLANLITAWSHEIKEVLGAMGLNTLESLRGSRERLRGINLDKETLEILGVKPAGR